jgi:hypothetical protein
MQKRMLWMGLTDAAMHLSGRSLDLDERNLCGRFCY